MRRTFTIAATIALAALVLLRVIDPAPVVALREAYFDLLQRVSPRRAADLPVRVVDIDDASLRELGQWPWPRDWLAELTRNLTDLGAAVIVFDVIFAERDRLSPSELITRGMLPATLPPDAATAISQLDHDRIFAGALQRSVPVLGVAASIDGEPDAPGRAGFVSVGSRPDAFLTPLHGVTPVVPELADAALGFGVLNVAPDGIDGIVRRVPLIWQGETAPVSSLAIEALRVALGESTVILMGVEGSDGLERIRLGEFVIPTNDRGEFRVRYREFDPTFFVPAKDVLADDGGTAVAEKVAGHIVFVGTSAAGLLDIRATPLGETVPGVSIHAQIVEQILSNDYLLRSDIISGSEIFALLVTGLVVSGVMAFSGPVASIIAGVAAGAILVGLSFVGFVRAGVLFDATFPVLGGFAAFSALALFQFVVTDREKRMIRRSFSRYVSEDVLRGIEERRHSLELGGEIRDVTVLFSDIRGFTGLSERLDAQALVGLLNDLFSRLTDCILARRGTIDKYIGDSIMAFWNAPIAQAEHEAAACRAALDMRTALHRFNSARLADGDEAVIVMVGLAAGPACVGNIGSSARFNYSVVGDTVNRAARIEACCRHVEFDVVISSEVASCIPQFAVLDAGDVDLKGVSGRTRVFALVGDEKIAAGQAFAKLREAHAELLHSLSEGEDVRSEIDACVTAARDVDAGLEGFYARIVDRTGDFADHSAATYLASVAAL